MFFVVLVSICFLLSYSVVFVPGINVIRLFSLVSDMVIFF